MLPISEAFEPGCLAYAPDADGVWGPVVVIEALWNRLGIGEILREKLRKKKRPLEYERALLAMTANRLCEPESKLGVWNRWLSKVYLPSCEGLQLRQLYEALLGPVEEYLGGAEELLIVPHMWLFEVPWAGLVAAE